MYRKAAVIAASAVAVVGAGTAVAVAATQDSGSTKGSLPGLAPATSSTSSSTTGAPAPGAKGKGKHGKGHHGERGLLRRVEHGSFVVKGKDGRTQTVDLIRGTVTAVSPTSITVQAEDRTSETFTVTSATKVRQHGAGKGATASISSIAKGEHVVVAGTGTGTPTATRVVETTK